MEKIIELEIQSLLPGVENDEDSCIRRLEATLQKQHGMQRAHLENCENGVKLCLHYDPETISVSEVKRSAERAGVAIVNRYRHEFIPIEGMDCSDCSLVIEHSLTRMEGVQAARVNYAAENLWIEYDTYQINRYDIERRIHSMGYGIRLDGRRKWLQKNRALLLSLLTGLLLVVGWSGSVFLGFNSTVSLAFYIAAYVAGGWEISKHAIHALRERRFDTDLLMIMAALGAAILGDFVEGALLLFLFSIGHNLEERALAKAQSAIRALADLAPKTALVRRDDREVEISVADIRLKDLAVIRPGTRIPVDGIVVTGLSGVDQSPVTGESIPVDKMPGDKVFAGTLNGEGALEVQVTRLAADSTLGRVIKLVEEAQAQKSPTQLTMERFERIFVPFVLAATFLVIVGPPFFGLPFYQSFLRAMTLLVAASPCALALGAPATILAGVAQAARNGVLVKGGAQLENLGRLQAIAFDKTGTITYGKPEVSSIFVFMPEICTKEQLLALAAALESRSMHPLAQAVVRYAQSNDISFAPIGEVESLTGYGMRSSYQGQMILVGSPKLINESQIEQANVVSEQVKELESNGNTVILVALGSNVVGCIALADKIRPDIGALLSELAQSGVQQTALLTGDNPRVAAVIAREAGLADFYADLLPEEKATAIRDLMDKYSFVAMVGDGVNDAPALARATVGIAMGGAGTDVALETADVALMGDNLTKLPFAIGLGRATRAIIQQNLVIALGVIAVLVACSLFGLVGIGTAVVFHEGSTILVVLNALRLLSYRG
ncbi:MAG TPA: heavy metal translocating P-type ATPase [Anaerolineaceae bacterium]|nr:heavy metal translocating P-type ATPase [Anaerolineaceae bacterium]